MALSITHTFVSAIADDPAAVAAGKVVPSNWNSTHTLTGDLSGYTITVSQISDAIITTGSSVSGTNTGDQNLAPYLTSSTAASTYVPQTTTVNGQALSGNITITNITGNAATVTTNANLTGPITSAGNATSIGSQTGTGSTFAMSASPTFTGTVNNAREIITSTSATAFSVGASGTTNPILSIDASTASVATGVAITGAAAGAGVQVSTISSAAAEHLFLSAKGIAAVVVKYALGDEAGNYAPFSVDTSGSSITNNPAFKIMLPSTGAQKAFQFSNGTDTAAWASFTFNSGGTGLAGFELGAGGSTSRDVFVYRASASMLNIGSASGNSSGGLSAGSINGGANLTITSGNIIANTAGKGLTIKSGTNARIGTGTLTAGTVTIANTSVTANTRVFLQDTTSGGLTNVGVLTAVTTAGTGFVVTSTLALDTSTFNWLLMESA